MTDKVRECLDHIEAVLLDPKCGADLWAILTALRGPDSGSQLEKTCTTVPIRRAAFPKLADCIEYAARVIGVDFGDRRHEGKVYPRQSPGYRNELLYWDHFNTHVLHAARVLGLELRDFSEVYPTPVKAPNYPYLSIDDLPNWLTQKP